MSQNAGSPADPELRALAANLRRQRERRGMSRKELALRIGATDRQVEHWENADSPPALRYLRQLALLFHETIEHLLIDPTDVEQRAQHIQTHIDMLATMTGASVILSLRHVSVRAVCDPTTPGQHSMVEIKGSVTSDGGLHGFEDLVMLPEDILLDEILEPDEGSG